MARPAATPSDSRSQDRRMQPTALPRVSFRGQRSKFPNHPSCADSRWLRPPSHHLISASSLIPRSRRPLVRSEGQIKTPLGEHLSGVLRPERGREGHLSIEPTSAILPSRTATVGSLRDSRNRKNCIRICRWATGGHLRCRVKGAWTEILGPQLSACADGTRTLCGSSGGCPGPGSGVAHREHPKADR